MTPEPAGLVGFWRFDAADLGGQSRGAEFSWFECDHQSGEWVAGNASQVCGTERLGGMGGSLRLRENGYVEAELPNGLAEGPITLSAWVSLYRSITQRMTVVSVVRPACQSAWLDLVTDGILESPTFLERSLILSVEKPVAGSAMCEVDEMQADLPSGFLDWGMGNWYHVGAIVDAANGHRVLVDGRTTSATSTVSAQRTAEPANAVHIGAGPTGSEPFSGLIDDVALFSKAVADDEFETFVTESTSVRADGQQWTAWSAAGSSATWKSDCRKPNIEESRAGAQVVVENGYWSAGGVFTRTPGGRNIRKLKKATLVANIPNREHFDFVLGSTHNSERCTWTATGTGKNRYEFDLDSVNHCDCPSTCDCRFSVEEARIGSRWDESGALEFSVCRVEFEWEEVDEDATVDLGIGPGGDLGLNEWCWRPISYHEGSHVDLDEALTNAERTVGRLVGDDNETALLAADFAKGDAAQANELCNLEGVEAIHITADMPIDFAYQVRIADFDGIAREWSYKWNGTPEPIVLCDSTAGRNALGAAPDPELNCGKPDDPISEKMRRVDYTRVRHIGIQKNYEVEADASISIESLEFVGEPGGNCKLPMASGGTGPE